MSGESPIDRHASTASELKQRLEAERRGTPFLVYRDGGGLQVIVTLTGPDVTVGRRDDNDVALDWDPEVSACTHSWSTSRGTGAWSTRGCHATART